MTARLRLALVLLAAVLAARPARGQDIKLPNPGDTWVQVRTAHFTLFGDASESKTKEVGLEMEKLHAVLQALKRGSGVSSPIPTFIYVFKNHQAMEPYLPRGEEEDSSFFFGAQDGNYVQLTAAWNSDPRRSVYHNYIYYFMDANFPPRPLWYEQGVAAYYSTFRVEGTEVRTGMAREDLLARLRGTMLIPLDRLLAADRKSPEYNDEIKGSIFNAESWALVHYLTLGNPERAPQLSRYMSLRQQDRPQDEAFREAFQTDYATLFGELVAYVRGNRFLYNRFQLSELKLSTEATATPMSYASVLCRLGELIAHVSTDRLPDAERFFQAALASQPSNADALAGLGMVRLRQEREAEAADFFGQAVATERADYRAYYYYARLKLQKIARAWSWPMTDEERAGIEAGRAALRQSIALNPDFPEARVELGRSFSVEQPDHLDEGIAELTIAARLLPSRPDVARDLDRLSKRKKEFDEAKRAAPAAAPEPPAPTTMPAPAARGKATRSQGDLDAVNALLAQGKEDEAVAMLEGLAAKATDGYRDTLEDELRKLKAGVARNKAMRAYNAAIALYNRHDYVAALQAFEKIAAGSPQTEAGRRAASKAAEIRALLKK